MIKIGLDMYIYAKLWLGGEQDKAESDKVRLLYPEIPLSENLNSVEIKFEIGYWRKANHIHKWFVDNIQRGVDDCDEYYVSRENLKKLLEICQKIFKDNSLAKELLPTQDGFFFGGTEYNKYYFDDIKDTIKIIEKCLKLPDRYTFEYHSSW